MGAPDPGFALFMLIGGSVVLAWLAVRSRADVYNNEDYVEMERTRGIGNEPKAFFDACARAESNVDAKIKTANWLALPALLLIVVILAIVS